MASIQSLKPNVTRAEAIDTLQGGMASLRRWFGPGALRSVAEVYVPFRLYEVEIANGPRRQRTFFALDAVSGTLDLYHFEHRPAAGELIEVETRNRPQPTLEDAQAVSMLEDKLRRLMFQRGFFRVRDDVHFRAARAPLDLHVPYWIGLYAAGENVRLRVLDAVRRRFEGAKARALFETWLAS